ncbi:MAG: glycosyltransferase family 2 protein [Fusobacteria bacterium]|nr:glycosyltransferase family 2 protein [Fusobacteriota bacterium]
MKISIVTVCLNSEKTIRETVESVLKQSYNDIEYIIIDGSSSDSTVDIIKSYEEKFKNRGFEYKWISEPDKGIYDAMNKGIILSCGEIVGLINSDDQYHNINIINTISRTFKEKKVGAVYGNMLVRKSENCEKLIVGKVPEKINGLISHKMRINHPTFFVRKSIYLKLGVFDIRFKVIADKDFIIRMVKNKVEIIKINEIVAIMDVGGISGEVRSLGIIGRVIRENYRIAKNNNFTKIETIISIFVMTQIVFVRYIKYRFF